MLSSNFMVLDLVLGEFGFCLALHSFRNKLQKNCRFCLAPFSGRRFISKSAAGSKMALASVVACSELTLEFKGTTSSSPA